MQQIHLTLGEPDNALDWRAFLALETMGECERIDAYFVAGSTASGRSSVILTTVNKLGERVGIEITARNLMGIIGGVRGKMIERGEIPVKVNPGMALMATPGKVHFALEAPLQEFDYTTAEAKKLWRTLRDFAEQSGR